MQVIIQNHPVEIAEPTLKIWRFIAWFQAYDGSSPSLREIARANYFCVATVIRHLDRLESWGAISIKPRRARGIKLLQQPPAKLPIPQE